MATDFKIQEEILGGQKQAVAISQTNQVISNAFQINSDDSFALAFQVTCSAVTGTAGIVKLQQSFDNAAGSYTDVDATNAKLTFTSATLKQNLVLNGYNTTFQAKMPLLRWLRFVATTTSGDTLAISSVSVLLHV